tara:strand:- start:1299 stop:1688 length:390 start_codon:yes stop_codon:yes gene_type:complete
LNKMEINASISVGELIDKITILEIKLQKIKDPKKLENINIELDTLNQHFTEIKNENLSQLKNNLKEVNLKLWQIEDDIRVCEKNQSFDKNFIELARSVYITNDQRFEIKNSINELFSSEIKEVKSYEQY